MLEYLADNKKEDVKQFSCNICARARSAGKGVKNEGYCIWCGENRPWIYRAAAVSQ